MKTWMNEIVTYLKNIYLVLVELQRFQEHTRVPLHERKLLTKQQVMDKLGMSDSTYKRNVKRGLLTPMRLNGIDEYFEEDILAALEESRRKGRT